MSDMDQLCMCGHNVYAHEDADWGTHECQVCVCTQFVDVEAPPDA